jgi:hypothetical protein
MIPVIMISMELMDLTLMDLKTNLNVSLKQQSYYNAECGMLDGLKRYDCLSYDGFRISIYYINFSDYGVKFTLTNPKNSDYAKVKLSYVAQNNERVYTIESTGFYHDCINKNTYNFTK